MNKITKLTGKFVIGYENDTHVIYKNGCIVFDGNTILYVGKNYDAHVDEEYDYGESIISPGFIDLEADIDTDHALIDVAFPKCSDDSFKPGKLYKTVNPYSEHDFYIRQKYSIAQMIQNGITTAMPIEGELFHGWSQTFEEHAILSNVAKEMGVRMYVGPSFRDRAIRGNEYDDIRGNKSFQDAIDFFERIKDNTCDLIKPFINPCQLTVTRPEILVSAMEFAKKNNAPMRLHAAEGVHEWEYTLSNYNKTTIDWFEDLGILNSNLIIPHCVVAKDSELEKLGHAGVSVVQTPFAEANVGSALLSHSKYLSYKINMTIGTDAQPLDMIRNMRFAWDLDRLCHIKRMFFKYNEDNTYTNLLDYESNYPRTTAADFFNAATINGAKALGRDDIGKLCTGAKADIIVISLDSLRVGPHEDPIRTLIMSCTGWDVTDTIVNGKFLMKNRVLLGINEHDLLSEGQQVYDKFINLYSKYDYKNRNIETFFPPTFEIK